MARIVAELGRPETADEAAARKAQSSRNYRASKTFRNLIAAILATLAVLAIVIFGVPRGEPAERPEIDVAAESAALESSLGRTVIVPEMPGWRVNGASLQGSTIEAWTVVYAASGESGYLNVAQGFDADETWPLEVLAGARPDGTVTIDGIAWDEYRIAEPDSARNVSYALATDAGTDSVMIYGSTTAEVAARAAEALAPGIRELREETP
jgi:hypothetical protein